MILVTGGIFQHKLDFIYEAFGLNKNDVCFTEISGSTENKKIFYKFNFLIEKWISENKDIENETLNFVKENPNIIVVLDQIGCGIVPIDKNEAKLREKTGRAGCILANKSEQVYNVAFGMGIKIKG